MSLNRPAKRSRSERGVVALVRQPLLGGGSKLQRKLPLPQPPVQLGEHQVHYLEDLLPCELMEDDDLIYTVEELRSEGLAQRPLHCLLYLALLITLLLVRDEPERPVLVDPARARVRGQDDHRVLEVHGTTLPVREPPVVEDLQHHVEDLRVRLLNLVEKNHLVRPATHRLRELPALVVSDVARRRADQPRDRVSLAVLAHVHAHECVAVVEQELRERPGKLRLSHTCRA